MTAARARGRRGQGTLEFILVLPLLMIMLCAVADYTHLADVGGHGVVGGGGVGRGVARPLRARGLHVRRLAREVRVVRDTASVTVTSADAPSKPVTLKSGDKSVTARYAREKVTVKVVEDVSCIFPLKSLGVKGATDDGWQVHSETSSIRSEIERS